MNANDGVSVLLGNGDGSFQPPATFAVSSNPLAIAVAISTRTDALTWLSRDFGDDGVSVLLGNGDGTFRPS